MVVTAHADDPEFLAGGTVARLVREGRERHSFYVGVDSPAVAAVVRAILRL
jgi:hypothetical protein